MSFTKKTWADDSTGNTPISAADLNRMENGIAAAQLETTASAGSSIGQLATDQTSGITSRWNGSAWRAWESPWSVYQNTATGWGGPGGGGTQSASYRWDSGDIIWNYYAYVGTGASTLSSALSFAAPPMPSGHAWLENNYQKMGLGTFQRSGVASVTLLVQLSGGTIVLAPAQVTTIGSVNYVRDGGVWPYATPVANDTIWGEIRIRVQ